MNDFKKFEQKAWEDKAARYQATWGQVSKQSIPVIVEQLLPANATTRILDCGCGPGELCAELARLGYSVTGCDYSAAMVAIAQANYPKISFTQEDVECLSFSDNSFDALSINFVLLHVPNPRLALKEGYRVLNEKGVLIVSMWQAPQSSPGLAMMLAAVKKHADLSVIPPAEDIFTFSNPETIESALRDIGFKAFKATEVPNYWHVQTAEDFFVAVQAGTRIGGTIDLQSPEIKAKIKEEIFVSIDQFETEDGYRIPTPSFVFSAQK